MNDSVVIGEGVIVETTPAAVVIRTAGVLIDIVFQMLMLAGGIYLLGLMDAASNLDNAMFTALTLATVVTALVIIPCSLETFTRGRSLGKLATGVQVVRDDGGPIRFRHALIRTLVGIGEIWFSAGVLAFFTAAINKRYKRLGDILAGTYAVSVRAAAPKPQQLVMPPYLAQWANHAQIAKLPDGLALAARTYLERAPKLSPQTRATMSQDLYQEIVQRVSPAPPPDTVLEDFIAAVLVSRRDRELQTALTAQDKMAAESALVRRLPFQIPDATN